MPSARLNRRLTAQDASFLYIDCLEEAFAELSAHLAAATAVHGRDAQGQPVETGQRLEPDGERRRLLVSQEGRSSRGCGHASLLVESLHATISRAGTPT